MNALALAALLGLLIAGGAGLLLDFAMRGRRITLSDRVAPHFGQAPRSGPSRWGRNRSPAPRPGDAALQERLVRAGRSPDVGSYRQGDLSAAALAAAVAVAFVLLVSARSVVAPASAALFIALAAACGVWLRRASLRRAGEARRARMAAQFPEFAEMLALAVAAGDAVGSALARCAQGMRGDLAVELRRASTQLSHGTPVPTALRDCAKRVGVDHVSRCMEAIAVASERGSPLAGVLRDQAADAREADRRSLIESAGKKEVGMLVPVVFGVLPLSVLFAVFPSVSLLKLSL